MTKSMMEFSEKKIIANKSFEKNILKNTSNNEIDNNKIKVETLNNEK